jgi:DNA polymerase-4
MGSQRALGRAPRSPEDLDAVLVGIVDRLTRRLRSARRMCRTVVLRLRFDDFSRASRSHTLPQATAATEVVLITARGLMTAALPIIQRRGLTLVGLTLSNLDGDGAVQLTLPFDRPRAGVLDATLDRLRERFGSTAITRGVLVGRDPGLSVPLLPD